MPTTENSLETGWLVIFTQAETDAIADSMKMASFFVGLIPEPIASTALSAVALVATAAGRVAKQKRLSLGLRLKAPGFHTTLRWSNVYDIAAPAPIPFFYSEADPASLARWRHRFGFATR
jgi:hypothetical protein